MRSRTDSVGSNKENDTQSTEVKLLHQQQVHIPVKKAEAFEIALSPKVPTPSVGSNKSKKKGGFFNFGKKK